MDKWMITMNYGLNVLKKCVLLIFLIPGTGYTEQLPSKPFKVCPEIVEAKDTPCRVLEPSVAVVHRIEKPNDDKKKIAELQHRIQWLEAKVLELQRNK